MKRAPLHAEAGRHGRAVLLCSAGLNLLLLAAVLRPSKNPSPTPPSPSPHTTPGPEASLVLEAALSESSAVVTNQVPFRWAQLESEDFRTYIANLRAVRCPERIIYDLIFHDLERL